MKLVACPLNEIVATDIRVSVEIRAVSTSISSVHFLRVMVSELKNLE